MQKFSDDLRARFPHRAHIFDDYEHEVGAWETAFRAYADIVVGEEHLLRVTRKLTARRLVAIQATNVASRGVNLANAVVLLLNRRHAHAAPAVARALFETCAMAVYADRRLVPLLEKRRSPKRTGEAHRLLYRLGLGTHPGSETSYVKALRVEKFISAMGDEVDEVMEGDEDTPPPWIDERTYGDAVRHSYSLLSELTHPNSPAITLSLVRGSEWTLQPDVADSMLTATMRPSWIALHAGRTALRDLVHAADNTRWSSPTRTPASARTNSTPEPGSGDGSPACCVGPMKETSALLECERVDPAILRPAHHHARPKCNLRRRVIVGGAKRRASPDPQSYYD